VSGLFRHHQNYAWGQDSWRDFNLTMKVLAPQATHRQVLFPSCSPASSGRDFGAAALEISQVIHSSFFDGDLEAFIYQSGARGCRSASHWC